MKTRTVSLACSGRTFVALAIVCWGLSAVPAFGVSDVVISQIYAGGGSTNALLKNDFVELFNRGASPVNITGWSVQYQTATGTGDWTVTSLTSFTLQPGQYYLVQEGQTLGCNAGVDPCGSNLPTPDATDTIDLATTGGKIAIVDNTTPLTGGVTGTAPLAGATCPTGGTIMDFVGYGTATCSETSPSPALGQTIATVRKLHGCQDTDSNLADFNMVAQPLVVRNSSVTNACGGSSPTPNIVISQLYGGGGNSGATLKNDFIELYNRGADPIDITGWSVQYASAAGTSWQSTFLTPFTIQPGQYYLVQESQGAGGTVNLPTPDAIGTITMSATSGKVALVNESAALSSTTCDTGTPTGATIMDFVGYGAVTLGCAEGNHPTPVLSNTTAAVRKAHGCQDTSDNLADFNVVTLPLTPRNSAVVNGCGGLSGETASSVNPVLSGNSVLVTVLITGGATPYTTVRVDLSTIDGSLSATQQLFDNGSNGDVTPNDSVFSYRVTVPCAPDPAGGATGPEFGVRTLTYTVTDSSPSPVTIHPTLLLTVADGRFLTVPPAFPTGGTPDDGKPVDTTRCAGETASFSAAADGGGLIYRWRVGAQPAGSDLNDGLTGSGSTIVGATTPRLYIQNVGAADAAAGPYYCRITSSCVATQVDQGPANLFIGTAATATDKLIKINEVYGNGGNSGAFYKNDYVELFNISTTTAVNVGGWSIQWGTSGTFQPIFDRPTRKVNIPPNTTIQPGTYLLVKLFAGAGGFGIDLPTPNLDLSNVLPSPVLSININPSAGKIALANISTSLTEMCPYGDGNSPNACNIVDFVGWDPSAGCAEGGNPAPNASNLSIFRNSACIDTDNNGNDFQQGLTNAAASGTSGAAHDLTQPTSQLVCIGGNGSLFVFAKGECVTYQWYAGNGEIDNGAGDDTLLTDAGVFSGTQTTTLQFTGIDAAAVAGSPYYAKAITPFGNAFSTGADLIPSPATPTEKQIVISQIYAAGGTGGDPMTTGDDALYQNDFIELYNKGTTAVDVTGWTVQYASAAGTSWSKTPLTGTIPPGQHYLVQEGSTLGCASGTVACGSALPTPDATGTINLSSSAGKVALAKFGGTLEGGCPNLDCRVVDFVGYGTAATCFDGLYACTSDVCVGGPHDTESCTTFADCSTGPAVYPNDALLSTLRKQRGCQDTDDNAGDFDAGPVIPRHGGGGIPFDFDNDGDVDSDPVADPTPDLNVFIACRTGPAVHYDVNNLPAGCTASVDCAGILSVDTDGDLDVDNRDFAKFQICHTGQGNPANANCAD